jgi:hypothetical protein
MIQKVRNEVHAGQGASEFVLDGNTYCVSVSRADDFGIEAARRIDIIVPVFAHNETALQLAMVCLESLRKFSSGKERIWAVDNNSPLRYGLQLFEIPGINIIRNQTEPRSSRTTQLQQVWRRVTGVIKNSGRHRHTQMWDGSYANAIAIEIALKVIGRSARKIVTLHSDTVAAQPSWINEFNRHLEGNVKAVGYRKDPGRVRALHVAGLLVDWPTVRSAKGNFFPSLKDEAQGEMEYDTGDHITVALKRSGFETTVLNNTYNDPMLANSITKDDPFRQLNVDRVLDTRGKVVFAHLGRGTSMASGGKLNSKGVTPLEWVQFIRANILSN